MKLIPIKYHTQKIKGILNEQLEKACFKNADQKLISHRNMLELMMCDVLSADSFISYCKNS